MNVAIYRTCDRPRYTESTFPRLVEETSPGTTIIMVENSGDRANQEKNQHTFESHADQRCEILVAGSRLGVTKPLIVGIEHFRKEHGRPTHVFNVDDDILVPKAREFCWDEVLAAMLDGPWGAAGLFYHRIPGDVVGEGLSAGVEGRFMAGMCAGFRYGLYERHPMKDVGIASLNIWSAKYARCGWSVQDDFFIKEIDKFAPEGQSLRYTEYREYSEHIDAMRASLHS